MDLLKKDAPLFVVNYIEQYSQGDAIMEKRTIQGSFNNGKFGDNINVQGDNVKQQKVTKTSDNDDKIEALFDTLIAEIKTLSPEDEIEDALDNAEKIKAAIESDDQPRAKKIFNWLPTAVQASATAVEIFKLIGTNSAG